MKLLIFILLITASPVYPLAYDSAIYTAQKGNWQDAHVALNSIITDNPDNADAMYDAGVAAYNVGNKCQAGICFTRAAGCSSDKNVCFRAHFNAGNTYVDEKKLEDALAEFDKAVRIEPDNEYARHNRDCVAEMLKQQEKKDQQKNDEQKNQDKQDKQDKQQKQDSNDQQSSDGNNQQGNDKQNQKNNSQKSDSSKDESLNNQAQQDQGKDTADRGDDAQRKEHGNQQEQQKNSGNHEQRDRKDELEKKSQGAQKEGDKQKREKHNSSPQQANVSEQVNDDKSNVSPQDGQEQAIDDPWLLKVLHNQELHDKAINKQLMEAKIRQHGGKHGQNCW